MTAFGSLAKAGFIIESSDYGTAATVGANNQIHLISESIRLDQVESSVREYQYFYNDIIGDNSGRKYSGSLLIEAHYSDMALLLVGLGMSHQGNSPQTRSAGNAYEHYIEPTWDIGDRIYTPYESPNLTARRRGTLTIEKQISIWQYISTMVSSFSFDADLNRVTWLFNVTSAQVDLDHAPNSSSSAWSFYDGSKLMFQDLVVRLKVRDKFVLSSDTIYVVDSGGIATVSIPDGTYYGRELAERIAYELTSNGTLNGIYKGEYNEDTRRFLFSCTEDFSIGTVGTLEDTLGFTNGVSSAREQYSPFDAQPSAFSAFSASDQINVSKISLTVNNNLQEGFDTFTSKIPMLPFNTNQIIQGSIELPRYGNDDLVRAANGATVFEMDWSFTGDVLGGGYSEELNFHFPNIVFIRGEVFIANNGAVMQRLFFIAQSPKFNDYRNFLFSDYNYRGSYAFTDQVECMGGGFDTLYQGMVISTAGHLQKQSAPYTWTSVGNVASATPLAIQTYNNKVYISYSQGDVYEWDDTSFTDANLPSVTDPVQDMIVFNDLLVVGTGSGGGSIYTYDGSTWTWAYISTGNIRKFANYEGYVYAVNISGGNTLVIRSQTGSGTWSTVRTITGAGTTASLIVHRNKLYASGNNDLHVYDGTSWSTLSTTMNHNVKHLESYMGALLTFENGGSNNIGFFDINDNSHTNLFAASNAFINKPIILDGRLMIPSSGATTIRFLEPQQPLMITVQNSISTNLL